MAAAHHKLSRRALLAGACAGAVVPPLRQSGLDPGSTFLAAIEEERWTPDQVCPEPGRRGRHDDGGRGAAWQKALARYARAEAALEAAAHVEDDGLFDRALSRHNAALARLLRTAAPDLAAAARKIELIVRHEVFELSFGEAAFVALQGDISRFAAVS